ncbi:MAG: extracellular solute-binding protein [Succinivibrio sp.]|nr:extracellular solute-binding protein [Succinivibrio sp.]
MKRIKKLVLGLATILLTSQACATSILHVWDDDGKSKGIAQAVADFEELNDCKVVIHEVPFITQIDKLRLEGPSGMGPDVLMVPSDRAGAAVVQGLISPIKFMQEDQDKYIRSAVSAFYRTGEIYAVPKVVETLVMFYNKEYLKKPYDTLDEYFALSEKMVSQNDGKYGLLAKWDAFYYVFGALQPFGSYVFGTDSDGNLDATEVGLSNEGAIKGVTLVKKFFDTGCFPKDIIGENGIAVIDHLFEDGKAAAVINGPWALEPYSKANLKFGVSPLPILPNGKPMSSFLGVKGYAISTWAKDHDLAEAFLQFINQPKYAKERFVKTQEIPPLKSVMADPLITNDEFANAIAVQASRAVPMPSIPEMSEVWGPIDGALEAIITGKTSVKDGLKAATDHINYQIEAFRSGM